MSEALQPGDSVRVLAAFPLELGGAIPADTIATLVDDHGRSNTLVLIRLDSGVVLWADPANLVLAKVEHIALEGTVESPASLHARTFYKGSRGQERITAMADGHLHNACAKLKREARGGLTDLTILAMDEEIARREAAKPG